MKMSHSLIDIFSGQDNAPEKTLPAHIFEHLDKRAIKQFETLSSKTCTVNNNIKHSLLSKTSTCLKRKLLKKGANVSLSVIMAILSETSITPLKHPGTSFLSFAATTINLFGAYHPRKKMPRHGAVDACAASNTLQKRATAYFRTYFTAQ